MGVTRDGIDGVDREPDKKVWRILSLNNTPIQTSIERNEGKHREESSRVKITPLVMEFSPLWRRHR